MRMCTCYTKGGIQAPADIGAALLLLFIPLLIFTMTAPARALQSCQPIFVNKRSIHPPALGYIMRPPLLVYTAAHPLVSGSLDNAS